MLKARMEKKMILVGLHTCQHLDIQNLDTQWPGVQGQSPWRESRPFCNFKGLEGNTIFILKMNVLKIQTGSVVISPLFFRNRDEKKKKKSKKKKWEVLILAVLKVVNRDDPDKIGTVGRYVSAIESTNTVEEYDNQEEALNKCLDCF